MYRILDMVSILPFKLNLTVGQYRRSNRLLSVSILCDDVAMVMQVPLITRDERVHLFRKAPCMRRQI